jgi:hypothetical protein
MAVSVVLNLDGGKRFNSGSFFTGSWLKYMEDIFWPQLFPFMVGLAEGRDGYKTTTDQLTNYAANVNAFKVRDLKIVALKATIRVLWTLFHTLHYNKATYSMYSGLGSYRSRLSRLLDLSDTLVYTPELEPWIQFLSKVFVPYPGGPVMFRWINFEQTFTHTNHQTYQDWHTALGNPDFSSSTEVGYIIADCELLLKALTGQHTNANYKTDFRLIESILNMLSFPTPKTPVKSIEVDAMAFADLFRGGFWAYDNKGAGDDVIVGYPDCKGSMDTLIPIQMDHPLDELDWMGLKQVYAFEHPTQATGSPWSKLAEDMVAYGCVLPNYPLSVTTICPAYRYYTLEDGWIDGADVLDVTDVSGCQDWLWNHPLGSNHQWASHLIDSEETEEWYNVEFARPASVRFQMPFSHVQEAFTHWNHSRYKVPMVR